jgi:hypothetical protein
MDAAKREKNGVWDYRGHRIFSDSDKMGFFYRIKVYGLTVCYEPTLHDAMNKIDDMLSDNG